MRNITYLGILYCPVLQLCDFNCTCGPARCLLVYVGGA